MGLRNRIAEYSNKTAAKKCGPKKKMKKKYVGKRKERGPKKVLFFIPHFLKLLFTSFKKLFIIKLW